MSLPRSCFPFLVASLACLLFSPRVVRAEDQRVAVLSFSGPRAGKIRVAAGASFRGKKGFAQVRLRDVSKVAKEQKADVSSAEGRKTVAGEMKVSAFIDGSTSKRRRKWSATITLYNGADGQVLSDQTWSARTLSALERKVRRGVWQTFELELQAATPPYAGKPLPIPSKQERARDQKKEEATPSAAKGEAKAEQVKAERSAKEAAAEDDDAEDSGADGKEDASQGEASASNDALKAASNDALKADLEIGIIGLRRELSYSNPIAGELPPYSAGAPGLYLDATLLPFAWGGDFGLLQGIGGSFRYETYFAPDSELESDEASTSFSTSTRYIAFGLTYLLRLGPVELWPQVEYATRSFSVEDAGDTPSDVPNVGYEMFRFGLAGRLQVAEQVHVLASFAYNSVVDFGVLGSDAYFSRIGGSALEGSLGAAYAFTRAFELRGALAGSFFSLDPDSQEGDAVVAEGVSDRYLSLSLGLGLRWGGSAE